MGMLQNDINFFLNILYLSNDITFVKLLKFVFAGNSSLYILFFNNASLFLKNIFFPLFENQFLFLFKSFFFFLFFI